MPSRLKVFVVLTDDDECQFIVGIFRELGWAEQFVESKPDAALKIECWTVLPDDIP